MKKHVLVICLFLIAAGLCACGHEHTVSVDPAVMATCTAEGKTEGAHCFACGEILVEQQTVPKTSHTVETDPAVPATCTTEGKSEGAHCAVCGEILTPQQTVAKTAHTVIVDPAAPATCTAEGTTEGTHCSLCGEVLQEQKTVEKLAHTVVKENATAATCTKAGSTGRESCKVCGAVIAESKTVAALGHSFGDWQTVTAPTMGQDGAAERSCTRCSAKETKTLEKLGYTDAYVSEVFRAFNFAHMMISFGVDGGVYGGGDLSTLHPESVACFIVKYLLELNEDLIKDYCVYETYSNQYNTWTQLSACNMPVTLLQHYAEMIFGCEYNFSTITEGDTAKIQFYVGGAGGGMRNNVYSTFVDLGNDTLEVHINTEERNYDTDEKKIVASGVLTIRLRESGIWQIVGFKKLK